MFRNWQPGDWIALLAIIVPILCASLGAFWLTAKKLGAFETEHNTMKATIAELHGKTDLIAGLDTAIKLAVQGMSTMQTAFVDFRREIREDRQETRDAIAGMRAETQTALGDIRADVRAGISGGKLPPATRRGRH